MIHQSANIVSKPDSYKLGLSNVLLIAGDGRNVGKTTLGCRIVSRISGEMKVVAVKVSPHFHPLTDSLEVLYHYESIVIGRETNRTSGKDSSRYLNAGAAEVYYVQCKDDGLNILATWMKDNFAPSIPVICETGGLGTVIEPSYSIFMKSGTGNDEQSLVPNSETIYNNDHPENVETNIHWQNQKWQK